MIKNYVIIVWLSLLSIVINSYAAEYEEVTDSSKIIVVEQSAPVFKIILKSNPSTGYSWSLKDYDNTLVSHIGNEYKPVARCNTEGQCATGVPGTEEWSFKVLPAGFIKQRETSVVLVYNRQWEKKQQNNKEVTFTINLVPKNAN